MSDREDLNFVPLSIENSGYKANKDICGNYQFGSFTLNIDYVQGDLFAFPSQLQAIVPQLTARLSMHPFKNHSTK